MCILDLWTMTQMDYSTNAIWIVKLLKKKHSLVMGTGFVCLLLSLHLYFNF